MTRWVGYAFASMFFAGLTAVLAKFGLNGISGDLGLAIRTGFVFIFVMALTYVNVTRADAAHMGWSNIFWLALSAVTTTLSWLFYYRAIKEGNVSTVAVIDKGSIVVAVILAWLLLREQMTARLVVGGILILAGLIVVAHK